MPAVIFTMLVILGIAAVVIAIVVMGMEGTGRSKHPELADAMARTARHLNGEGAPPRGLRMLFDEADDVRSSRGSAASAPSAVPASPVSPAPPVEPAEPSEPTSPTSPVPEDEEEDVDGWGDPRDRAEHDMAAALEAPPADVADDDPYGIRRLA